MEVGKRLNFFGGAESGVRSISELALLSPGPLLCHISTLILPLFLFSQGAQFWKPAVPEVFPGHWGGLRLTMPGLLLLAAALLSSWAQLPAEASSWW